MSRSFGNPKYNGTAVIGFWVNAENNSSQCLCHEGSCKASVSPHGYRLNKIESTAIVVVYFSVLFIFFNLKCSPFFLEIS